MRRFRDVTYAVWWRSFHNLTTNPQFFLLSIILRLFFFMAFAGRLWSVGDVSGFDFPCG